MTEGTKFSDSEQDKRREGLAVYPSQTASPSRRLCGSSRIISFDLDYMSSIEWLKSYCILLNNYIK